MSTSIGAWTIESATEWLRGLEAGKVMLHAFVIALKLLNRQISPHEAYQLMHDHWVGGKSMSLDDLVCIVRRADQFRFELTGG